MTEGTSIPPIVVGVSRRTGSPDAVRFAVDEAGMRGCGVLAITAWRPPKPPGSPAGRPAGFPEISPRTVLLAEQDRIEAAMTNALESDLASLGVRFEVRRGAAAAVLLEAAARAQLLVLDSPRSGLVSSVPKSWIAPSIIFRAPCPVVIMPPHRDESRRSRVGARLLEEAGTPDRPGLRPVPPLLEVEPDEPEGPREPAPA